MASTRLRKTFHYPSSSSSDSEDLDEEHQETLITTLETTDRRTNDFYRKAFTPLPAISVLLYIPSIVLPTSARTFLIGVLSVSNLVATAWILWFLPIRNDDLKGKRAMYKGDPRGPFERYIAVLNAVLSAFLGLVALLAWRRGLVEEFWRGILPGVIFLVVLFARSQMAAVDITGLERLKYNYKGA